ncbi:HEPN domain-containing protein [Pseudomonas sp. TE36184]
MERIDKEFLRRLDDELMSEGLSLHQRPFHVVAEWMKSNNIEGNFLDERIWTPLMEDYRALYPSGDFSIPGLVDAGVAIRDTMYPARVNVGFGTFGVTPLDMIEITKAELENIFKHYPELGWKALYSACDLWDLAYGVDDLRFEDSAAVQHLNNAKSAISSTARTLFQATDTDSAIQTCCLAAELAMKGALLRLGVDKKEVRKHNHNLVELAESLVKHYSNSNDDRLLEASKGFPNYVNTRYSDHGLTRVQLMSLAMRALFIAAEAVRRITDRNLAGKVEASERVPRPSL